MNATDDDGFTPLDRATDPAIIAVLRAADAECGEGRVFANGRCGPAVDATEIDDTYRGHGDEVFHLNPAGEPLKARYTLDLGRCFRDGACDRDKYHHIRSESASCTWADEGARTVSCPLEARGGNGELGYTLEPQVPGLEFDPDTLTLTGTPTTAGAYKVSYSVVDADENTADSD